MYTGKLVRLREYRKEDLPTVVSYLNNPEVKKYMKPGVPFPLTLTDEEKWFEHQSFLNPNYNFAIETQSDGKYIGGCGLKDVDWKNRHTEVGIFIGDVEYQGKGYGTDAMNVLIDFIFKEMDLNKIKLDVYAFNERAIKSYEKCGFVVEGRFKDELFRFGKYHDTIRMALFKSEYAE